MASYVVGAAASNRSSCKACKAKIDKGALRVGTVTPGPGDYDMTSWRHLECQKKPKNISSVEDIVGYNSLSAEEKAKVDKWFEGGGTPKKRSAAELESDCALEPKKMKLPELKKALKEHGADAAGSKEELRGRLMEVKQHAEAEAKYQKMTIPQLKGILENNNQLKGGTKQELVDRCIDGKLFGALPRCPKCGGGVLRVVYASKVGHGGKGRFSCPGYYDDDHFVRCNHSADECTREEWVEE